MVFERALVGFFGLRKAAEADRPVVMKVFDGDAGGVAARISGIVVGTVRHDRPVHELGSRIMAVGVVVEQVDDRKISGGNYQTSPVHGTGELVRVGLDVLPSSAQADRVACKQPRAIERRPGATGSRDLAVAEPSQSSQSGQRDTDGDFGVEIEFTA